MSNNNDKSKPTPTLPKPSSGVIIRDGGKGGETRIVLPKKEGAL